MTEELTSVEVSASQRFIGNITAAVGVLLCGIFLVLCGTGVIPLDMTAVLAPSILITLGAILLINALVQTNTVSLYLSVLLLVCAAVSTVCNFTDVTYEQFYPFYIAAPALASLITMLMSGNYQTHLKFAVIFGIPAIILFMQSFNIWLWQVTVAAFVVFVGLIALYIALTRKSRAEE